MNPNQKRDKALNDEARKIFQAEEATAAKARELASKHDCAKAGCDIDPKGKKITKTTAPGG